MPETKTDNQQALDAVPYNDPDRADWRALVDKRLNDGAATMKQLKSDLADNTAATNAVKADTATLIDLLNSFHGAMKVLDMLGRLAKPLSYLVMLGTALYSVIAIVKGGGEPPK
jgi:hypothetical protein